MNRDRETFKKHGEPPSATWLFAQEILGNPIPAQPPTTRSQDDLAKLRWLATISPRHADELRQLESTAAEKARIRQSLIWAAQISPEAAAKLRDLLREEAQAEQLRWHGARNDEIAPATIHEWNETEHPRAPKGESAGGQFVSKGGSNTPAASIGSLATISAPSKPKFQTVSSRALDSGVIWKGAVIAARGRGLPTPLLDWNAKYEMTIVQGTAPRFIPGRLWGATVEIDDLNVRRLSRIGKAGRYDPATDKTTLGSIYNEAFHRLVLGK